MKFDWIFYWGIFFVIKVSTKGACGYPTFRVESEKFQRCLQVRFWIVNFPCFTILWIFFENFSLILCLIKYSFFNLQVYFFFLFRVSFFNVKKYKKKLFIKKFSIQNLPYRPQKHFECTRKKYRIFGSGTRKFE